MSVHLHFLRGNDEIKVTFDAVITETHTASALVTTHPVEKGADITDHVQIAPRTITLEAIVTSTPLELPTTHANGATAEVATVSGTFQVPFNGGSYSKDVAAALKFDRDMGRPLAVWRELDQAFSAKSVFRVETAIREYADMVVTALSSPREAGSARLTADGKAHVDKLTFSIEMQQIRVVGSKVGTVTRKPSTPTQTQHRGHKPKKEATAQDNRTAAARGVDAVRGR